MPLTLRLVRVLSELRVPLVHTVVREVHETVGERSGGGRVPGGGKEGERERGIGRGGRGGGGGGGGGERERKASRSKERKEEMGGKVHETRGELGGVMLQRKIILNKKF